MKLLVKATAFAVMLFGPAFADAQTDTGSLKHRPSSATDAAGSSLRLTQARKKFMVDQAASFRAHLEGETDFARRMDQADNVNRALQQSGSVDAITAILLVEVRSCPDGYNPVTALDGLNGDLNQSSGGKDIFVCVTRNAEFGEPITGMRLVQKVNCAFQTPGEWYPALTSGSLNSDLNQGAGGADIFICYTSDENYRPDDAVLVDINLRAVNIALQPEKPDGLNGDLNQGAGGSDIFFELAWDLASILPDIDAVPAKTSYDFGSYPVPQYTIVRTCFEYFLGSECTNHGPCWHAQQLVSFVDEDNLYTFVTFSATTYGTAYLMKAPLTQATSASEPAVESSGQVIWYEQTKDYDYKATKTHFNHPGDLVIMDRFILTAGQNWDPEADGNVWAELGCAALNANPFSSCSGCPANLASTQQALIIWDFSESLNAPVKHVILKTDFNSVLLPGSVMDNSDSDDLWGGEVDGRLIIQFENKWLVWTDEEKSIGDVTSWKEIENVNFPECGGASNAGKLFVKDFPGGKMASFETGNACYSLRSVTYDAVSNTLGISCENVITKCTAGGQLVADSGNWATDAKAFQTLARGPDGKVYSTGLDIYGRNTLVLASDGGSPVPPRANIRAAEDLQAVCPGVWSQYLLLNADLKELFGNDEALAKEHFIKYGIGEGRMACTAFDPSFYLQSNADLDGLYGSDGYLQALSHWLLHGIDEGRQGSDTFDPISYLQINADLGSYDYLGALIHWYEYGIDEGRDGSPSFSPAFYLEHYADLGELYGPNDYYMAIIHWYTNGKEEGRDGTPIDNCPDDPDKMEPGSCGCGVPEVPDCGDNCPDDPDKTEPGSCGCGVPETPGCGDDCPDDPDKTEPGSCGCGIPESPGCGDDCPDDPDKTEPGSCGCGVPETPGCRAPGAPTPSPTASPTMTIGTTCDGFNLLGFCICFSGHSMVDVQGQGETRMDELKIGDSVLTADGTYDKVYSFSHKDSLLKATYLQIFTDTTDKPLEISATHMLFANGKLVPSAQAKVGDALVSKGGVTTQVVSIRKIQRRGAYAPLTASGVILVNGIVASNYIEQEAFKSFVSPTTQHWMQHGAFAPYRVFCGLFGCKDEIYDEATGHSNGIVMWLYLYNWLEQHPTIALPAFVYLVAVPGHWMLLNMAHLIAAALGFYVWKKTNKKEVAPEDNIEVKKPTEQFPKTKA